jgi:RNA polymerase sigma factor (sigma-70 family)
MSGDASKRELDDKTLAEWHARFRIPLLRFFERRTRPDIDREDLVQEVFAALARRGDLDSIEKAESYLFQSAQSVLNMFLRARQSRPHETSKTELEDDIPTDAAYSPERILLGREAIEQLGRALADLPERTRTIFALYHLEDVPQSEIAKRLGLSLSSVEKHMARANHFLLGRLEGYF